MARFNLADLLEKTYEQQGCFIWAQAKSSAGYGQIWDGQKVAYVHRLVAEIKYGSIPQGLDVMHACDVRACCNPDHLSIGTRAENMRDASKKGRLFGKPYKKGQEHPSAKINDEQVKELRSLRDSGSLLRDLSSRYGISIAQVSKIVRKEARTDA